MILCPFTGWRLEDHDYEEIKYFKLYGKKYVWNTEQSGAVGRFNTKGLNALVR